MTSKHVVELLVSVLMLYAAGWYGRQQKPGVALSRVRPGVRGWLAVLVLSMLAVSVFVPVRLWCFFIVNEVRYPIVNDMKRWHDLKLYTYIVSAIAVILAWRTIWALMSHRNAATLKSAKIAVWVIWFGASLSTNLVIPWIVGSTGIDSYSSLTMCGGLLLSAVWHMYLRDSARIKVTYMIQRAVPQKKAQQAPSLTSRAKKAWVAHQERSAVRAELKAQYDDYQERELGELQARQQEQEHFYAATQLRPEEWPFSEPIEALQEAGLLEEIEEYIAFKMARTQTPRARRAAPKPSPVLKVVKGPALPQSAQLGRAGVAKPVLKSVRQPAGPPGARSAKPSVRPQSLRPDERIEPTLFPKKSAPRPKRQMTSN